MRVIGRGTLRQGWERHPGCEQPFKAWLVEAQRARWHGFGDIADRWRRARELPGDRVLFEMGGGELRLVVAVRYDMGVAVVRFAGTRAEHEAAGASHG